MRTTLCGACRPRLEEIVLRQVMTAALLGCASYASPPTTSQAPAPMSLFGGCYDVIVLTDSIAISAWGRSLGGVPDSVPDVRALTPPGEEQFWLYLSAESVPSADSAGTAFRAIRPHVDPTEVGAWRQFASDSAGLVFAGYGETWVERFRLAAAPSGFSGWGAARTHRGWSAYLRVRGERRPCPADSLSAADTTIDAPGAT